MRKNEPDGLSQVLKGRKKRKIDAAEGFSLGENNLIRQNYPFFNRLALMRARNVRFRNSAIF